MAYQYPGIYAQYDTKQEVPVASFVAPAYVFRPPRMPHSIGRLAGPDGLYQRDIGPYKAPLVKNANPIGNTRAGQLAAVRQSQSGNNSRQYVGLRAPRIPTSPAPPGVRSRE